MDLATIFVRLFNHKRDTRATVAYHMNENEYQRSYHHLVYENHSQAFRQDL